MKYQLESKNQVEVIVMVQDGPETIDECINDLEIVYDIWCIPEGLELKYY